MQGCASLLCRGLFVLWGGWPFYFFDYCYFYRDTDHTQWKPLQRREGLCLSLRAAGYEFELHRKLEGKKRLEGRKLEEKQ